MKYHYLPPSIHATGRCLLYTLACLLASFFTVPTFAAEPGPDHWILNKILNGITSDNAIKENLASFKMLRADSKGGEFEYRRKCPHGDAWQTYTFTWSFSKDVKAVYRNDKVPVALSVKLSGCMEPDEVRDAISINVAGPSSSRIADNGLSGAEKKDLGELFWCGSDDKNANEAWARYPSCTRPLGVYAKSDVKSSWFKIAIGGRGFEWNCIYYYDAAYERAPADNEPTRGGGVNNPPPTVILKHFWNSQRGDNFTTATPTGVKDAKEFSYVFCRDDCKLLSAQAPGTVPLKLFFSTERNDNCITATPEGEKSALDWGYKFIRVEGYVYEKQIPGTIPLKLYYNDKRKDNFTTANAQGEQDALSSGYQLIRIEGYVLPP